MNFPFSPKTTYFQDFNFPNSVGIVPADFFDPLPTVIV